MKKLALCLVALLVFISSSHGLIVQEQETSNHSPKVQLLTSQRHKGKLSKNKVKKPKKKAKSKKKTKKN